jgi:hypothetical protein
MSRSEPDATRIVRLWLEEGVTALPDHVLDTVLDQLPATSQRRSSWLARRSPTMNKFVTFGLAAAAVVVAAFLGYRFLIEPNIGGPPPSPSPSPSAESSAPEEPTPASFEDHPGGTLAPGSYVLTSVEPFRITFTAPAGWEKLAVPAMLWSRDEDKSTVAFFTVDDVFNNPCDPTQGSMGVGPTVDDLVTALEGIPGYTATSDQAAVGGYLGTRLVTTWSDPGCPEGVEAQLLRSQPENFMRPHPGDGDDLFNHWHILDVNGERLVITTAAPGNASDQRIQDIESILDSTLIE